MSARTFLLLGVALLAALHACEAVPPTLEQWRQRAVYQVSRVLLPGAGGTSGRRLRRSMQQAHQCPGGAHRPNSAHGSLQRPRLRAAARRPAGAATRPDKCLLARPPPPPPPHAGSHAGRAPRRLRPR